MNIYVEMIGSHYVYGYAKMVYEIINNLEDLGYSVKDSLEEAEVALFVSAQHDDLRWMGNINSNKLLIGISCDVREMRYGHTINISQEGKSNGSSSGGIDRFLKYTKNGAPIGHWFEEGIVNIFNEAFQKRR